MDIDEHDELKQRRRLLGHAVPFRYCRQLPEGRPWRLIVDCWQGYLDASAFLREHYTPEQIEAIVAPPKPKLTSLVELIERAKRPDEPTQL